ncbi:MAG: CHY zinc finger protein [Halobacteriales archaeon]
MEGHEVRGRSVDDKTRCAHYGTERDIVAIKFACCETYYPCFRCHEETADHGIERIPRDRWDEPAVLCGNCGAELTVGEYTAVDECPGCDAPFNPDCADHYDRYFDGFEGVRSAAEPE